MPEEKTKLGNQTAPEKKSDAAKLPNAPPKTEKPPDKNDGIKPASAAEPQKPEDKSSTPPPAEVKKTDASGKDSRKDTVLTGDVKKPEASVKSPPAPAEAKKPATPANTPGKIGGKDTAPVSNAEKPGAAAKPLEKPAAKVIPEDSSKKPDGKTDAVIPPTATEAKKPDTPANIPGKVSSKDTASVIGAEKPDMTSKPPEKPAAKVIPENGHKKPEGKNGATIPPAATEARKPDATTDISGKVSGNDTAPVSGAEKSGAAVKPPAKAADEKKPPLNKPVPPPAQKTEPSAKIMLGGKLHDPITPPKAADPPKGLGEQKGVRVTQIFEDRLDYPDEKALNSLPIPKEGEGFSMRLHPAYFYQFLDHPFSVNREVKDYIELYESIRDNGINEPVKARPREKGGLELISGHRRHDIASRLNYPVPVIIAQVDDDTARVEVVDGNLHRMDIPTSELARAAKMKMEALARKAGRRSKMEQLTSPEPKKRTDQIVAEDMGISRNQVNRLVKINDLVPELKQQVDDKKLGFMPAVEISYIKPKNQRLIAVSIDGEQSSPSHAQAKRLRELDQAGKLNGDIIDGILSEKKKEDRGVIISTAELEKYFGKEVTPAKMKEQIISLLDDWKAKQPPELGKPEKKADLEK